MSRQEPEESRRDETIVSFLIGLEPEIYVNSKRHPVIVLPLEKDAEHRRPYQLDGKWARTTLAKAIWQSLGIVVHQHEIRRAIEILIGLACEDIRSDVELADILDDDPLLEALSILLSASKQLGAYKGTCTKLLSDLTKVATKERLDMKSPLWPKDAPRLSLRLGDRQEIINSKMGYLMKRDRGPDGNRRIRIWSNHIADGDDESSSIYRQVDKESIDSGLASIDDADGTSDLTKLFAKIASNKGNVK